MDYIKSSAFAKKVQTNGNTIEQYPPPMLYTKKNAATDTKNNIQYKAVDFFVDSIFLNFDKNNGKHTKCWFQTKSFNFFCFTY